MPTAPAPATEGRWEHFHHEADIGVRGYGPAVGIAFQQAARGLTAVICDPDTVADSQAVPIQCEAPDLELLLADWLNALVYEMAIRKMLFSRFQVEITGAVLRATAWGEPLDAGKHQPAVEIKGATYTELKVARTAHGEWLAQCVVDV